MDALVAYFEAVRLHQSGDINGAEALYAQVLSQHANFAPALANYGAVQAALGRMQEAVDTLQKAVETDTSNHEAWMNLAMIMVQAGQKDQARHCFQQIVAIVPNHTDALFQLGMLSADAGNMPEALQLAEAAVQSNPNHGPAKAALGWILHETGHPEKAIPLFRDALHLAPNDFNAWVLYGNACRDTKQTEEAIVAYRKALEINPGQADVERNLRRTLRALIPGWHQGMLADTGRNNAYQEAIERNVNSDSVVLDIGTGSGLLALMAARAGAKHVYACEMVPIMAETARQVVQDNGFSDRITIISKKSTDVKIGEELPEKANLVVSEILDCGLLGELVWPSIRHARQQLLVPGALAIPRKATVHAAPIMIPHRRMVAPIGSINGFDLSAFDRFRIPGEYDQLQLNNEPHTLLAEPFVVGDFNLSEPPPLIHDMNPLTKEFEVDATTDGTLHGVTFWFDLDLDGTTQASSKPDGDLVHWGQAMCYFETDTAVKKGDTLKLTMVLTDQLIRFGAG